MIVEELIKDNEPEVRSIAVLKLPDICTYLEEMYIKNKVLPWL